MIKFQTDRLIAKSNLIINSYGFEYPQSSTEIDIFAPPVNKAENTGFAFYLNESDSIPIVHIDILNKRNNIELSYGTDINFRNKGYAKEALYNTCSWIFKNTKIDKLYAYVNPNNKESISVLERTGFKIESDNSRVICYYITPPNLSQQH